MPALDAVRARIFDKRFDWGRIDRAAALAQPAALDHLREACLVECYLPVYTSKMMDLFWDDADAIEVFTIESFEAYTHYYSLRRYLDIVGYHPVLDADVIAVRARDLDVRYTDRVRELVNFMATEQFAASFFSDLLLSVQEPVLRTLLPRFAQEEVHHSQLAYELLQRQVERDPGIVDHILEMAAQMRHVGTYVLPKVSPAGDDNVKTLVTFGRRIEALTGRSLAWSMVSGGGTETP